ncbi:RPM1-interacting protein 4 [Rhynchospora pubera]|uniref:RPM1-interacting protein 4 n=1 Tax=Rhynchospora pubera TaxID=906938 RepID=A0AAV8G2K5_9POAL|nr:RPM1-interacting protein 4 [Rhynchospora pubera]
MFPLEKFSIRKIVKQQQQSLVPKFGNWEEQGNAPYTAYFDNARINRKSGGKMVNPNDPSENPEAFTSHASPMRAGLGSDQNQRDREEVVHVNQDHPHLGEHVKRQTRTSGAPDRSPLHPGRTKGKATGRGDDMLDAGSAVPKFGDWDKDPSSAEGYTGIFENVRKEKQTGASKSPMITDDSIYLRPSNNSANYKSSVWNSNQFYIITG